eukprot:CAMPEP_0171233336 /NCGR_PEP_ID=MMETSP0790-20130122/40867_1 /TAXON_ID=2925 /ORGANISM="Alexandrium catenella, Strain OF101" /LENGTH=43 /DNA_ID= /DNA_START= /DNA_END= /DNA_ORIENTATION=
MSLARRQVNLSLMSSHFHGLLMGPWGGDGVGAGGGAGVGALSK